MGIVVHLTQLRVVPLHFLQMLVEVEFLIFLFDGEAVCAGWRVRGFGGAERR
jgi:hypothetical protein